MILNVGGMKHQVRWETIEKFPKSRLHNLRFAITEGMNALSIAFLGCRKSSVINCNESVKALSSLKYFVTIR